MIHVKRTIEEIHKIPLGVIRQRLGLPRSGRLEVVSLGQWDDVARDLVGVFKVTRVCTERRPNA